MGLFAMVNLPGASRLTCLVSVSLIAGGIPGAAQEQSPPLSIESLLTSPTIAPVSGASLSPDGAWLAYTAVSPSRSKVGSSGSVPWYVAGGDIWLAGTGGQGARQITAGPGSNWAPSWSPDGRLLAFLAVRDSSETSARLWVWDMRLGRARQVSDASVMDPWGRLGRLEWLGDGRRVIVKLTPMSRHKESPESERASLDTLAGLPTVQLIKSEKGGRPREKLTSEDGLNSLLSDLGVVDVVSGSFERLATGVRICSYIVSPDRRKLAWAAASRYSRPGSYQLLVDVFVRDLETSRTRRLVADAPLVYSYPNAPLLSWAPTSAAIAYRLDGPSGSRDEVYVADLKGARPQKVAEGSTLSEPLYDGRPLWDPRGKHVLFVRSGDLWRASVDGSQAIRLAASKGRWLRLIEHGAGTAWAPDAGRHAIVVTGNPATKAMGFARLDLQAGHLTQLVEEARWYDTTRGNPPVVAPDGRGVAYVVEGPEFPPDFWFAPGDSLLRGQRITDVSPTLRGHKAGTARVIEWQSMDGDTIRGALVYPAKYTPNKRYPLIVKVYGGGNLSDDLNRFGFAPAAVENLQVFASRGYAVLMADSRLRMGSPALDLLKSVLPGVDRAVELGVADPDRIGVMGHSYGGYSTLALITQSKRFRAAVMRGGFGDLVSLYGYLSASGTSPYVAWLEEGNGRMGGAPWEMRERYMENSPIFQLDRVEAPLLIIHGTADPPLVSSAEQVFTGLRRLNKRADYARYQGEDHWEANWSLPNQIDYLERVVAWFDEHLK